MTDDFQYHSFVGLATVAYRVGGHTAKEIYTRMAHSYQQMCAGSRSDNDKRAGNYSQKAH